MESFGGGGWVWRNVAKRLKSPPKPRDELDSTTDLIKQSLLNNANHYYKIIYRDTVTFLAFFFYRLILCNGARLKAHSCCFIVLANQLKGLQV